MHQFICSHWGVLIFQVSSSWMLVCFGIHPFFRLMAGERKLNCRGARRQRREICAEFSLGYSGVFFEPLFVDVSHSKQTHERCIARFIVVRHLAFPQIYI